jgi:uncharacterized protein YbjT (DUF2867 family)
MTAHTSILRPNERLLILGGTGFVGRSLCALLSRHGADPDVFTLGELVKLAGRWSGHERPVLALPPALGRLQAGVMELLPGKSLMSRDNLQSMLTPNVASGRLPSLRDLGVQAASLDSVAPGYLAADRAVARGQ